MTQQIPNTNIGGQFQYNVPVPVQRISSTTNPVTVYGFNNGDEWFNTASKTIFVFSFGSWTLLPGASTGQPISWTQTNTSQSLAVNMGYLVTSGATQIALQLPLTSKVGDTIVLKGAITSLGPPPASPGFIITQGAGQQILQDNTVGTTNGAAGSLSITSMGAYVSMICEVANTIWVLLPVSNGSFVTH